MSYRTEHTVLIVDDDSTNRLALAELLNDECRIILAKDGATALQRCRDQPDIDLILLDISMPGIDGYNVVRQLQADERTADIAIIFITGLTKEEDEEQGLSLGAVDYIGKPVHPGIFLARVRNHLKLISPKAHQPPKRRLVPSEGGLTPRRLASVKKFISEHLGEELSLESIARAASISPSHFSGLFKQSTGQSPHQYLMISRIEKAKDLLLHSATPIAEVALQLGFADQSHLTRLMRRYTGMTPRMIREG